MKCKEFMNNLGMSFSEEIHMKEELNNLKAELFRSLSNGSTDLVGVAVVLKRSASSMREEPAAAEPKAKVRKVRSTYMPSLTEVSMHDNVDMYGEG